MNNINLKAVKPQFIAPVILALRGDKAIRQTVFDLRGRFNVQDRPFNKTDFYKICESEKIIVIDNLPDIYVLRGIYLVNASDRKKKGVFISCHLSKQNYLKVGFHELGHHFLHRQQMTRHNFRKPQMLNIYVKEAQANYFSDLMLSGGQENA